MVMTDPVPFTLLTVPHYCCQNHLDNFSTEVEVKVRQDSFRLFPFLSPHADSGGHPGNGPSPNPLLLLFEQRLSPVVLFAHLP